MITDNATSYSEFQCYQRCPMKYKYNYVYRLERKVRDVNLHRGILAHTYLEKGFLALQKGGDPFAALDAVFEMYMGDEYTNIMLNDELIEHEDMVREAKDIITNYFLQDHWKDWEILHVEETFYIQVEGQVVSFTPDLVIRRPDGTVWVVDHKTTSSKLDDKLPFGDLQAGVYITGVRAVYPETVGFIWDYIRWKLPVEPRLTKTGQKRVAYLNTIDTTYQVLRDFVVEEGLVDDADHRARLLQLKEMNTFFQTLEYTVSDEAEETFWADLLGQKKLMDLSVSQSFYFRTFVDSHYGGCNSCGYNIICKAEMEGGATEALVEEFYQPLDMSHRNYEEA